MRYQTCGFTCLFLSRHGGKWRRQQDWAAAATKQRHQRYLAAHKKALSAAVKRHRWLLQNTHVFKALLAAAPVRRGLQTWTRQRDLQIRDQRAIRESDQPHEEPNESRFQMPLAGGGWHVSRASVSAPRRHCKPRGNEEESAGIISYNAESTPFEFFTPPTRHKPPVPVFIPPSLQQDAAEEDARSLCLACLHTSFSFSLQWEKAPSFVFSLSASLMLLKGSDNLPEQKKVVSDLERRKKRQTEICPGGSRGRNRRQIKAGVI